MPTDFEMSYESFSIVPDKVIILLNGHNIMYPKKKIVNLCILVLDS